MNKPHHTITLSMQWLFDLSYHRSNCRPWCILNGLISIIVRNKCGQEFNLARSRYGVFSLIISRQSIAEDWNILQCWLILLVPVVKASVLLLCFTLGMYFCCLYLVNHLTFGVVLDLTVSNVSKKPLMSWESIKWQLILISIPFTKGYFVCLFIFLVFCLFVCLLLFCSLVQDLPLICSLVQDLPLICKYYLTLKHLTPNLKFKQCNSHSPCDTSIILYFLFVSL